MKKIKVGGLNNDAKKALLEIKVRGAKIIDLMEKNDSLSDSDLENFSAILGSLAVQATVIELALNEGLLMLEHRHLIAAANKTVKEIDLVVFN